MTGPLSHLPVRIRHRLAMRRIVVSQIVPLSTRMRRIVFTGADLHDFVAPGADDHVRLFFPSPGQAGPVLPRLVPRGKPDGHAPDGHEPDGEPVVARDYTPRRFDPASGELTIDFVLHDSGPAACWARHAVSGLWLGMGGPAASYLPPPICTAHLLIGDDTALPAIARMVEGYPVDHAITVLLATEETPKTYPLRRHGALTVHRYAPSKDGADLIAAIEALTLPPLSELHVWIAGEIDIVRHLRSHLIQKKAVPRDRIRAAGYWRAGKTGGGSHMEIGAALAPDA
ncbi:siderophore-interacting protein [Swaminathania salitolerans]|nr:siderophore-interacting protein [Swaminathania salitolerans]GBQ10544.1 siderophore-interacting protein [Swaminathania salitolerans LMG 21291]